MPAPLCKCDSCGHVFNSQAIFIGAAVNVTFSNNREQCPKCGAMANMMDGVFNVGAEAFEIIAAGQLTRELYEQFGQLIEKAQATDMAPDTFVEEATAISPELGESARIITSKKSGWLAIAALVVFLMKSCDLNVDVTVDVNDLIETYIEQSAGNPKE